MAFTQSKGESGLTHSQWASVVMVAGIGTILEWFDFYIYAQLNSTLKKVFFSSVDPTAQALAYWGSYAVGFAVRPIGAIVFGHIGDTVGRNRALLIAIVCMAVPTAIIGCLPTYATAGIAAPAVLMVMRMLQGLAMGGEFGSAVVYISELAGPSNRGKFVALLQMTVNIGMVLATVVVMILEAATTDEQMLLFGWRIPFLLAFLTALIGFFLRRGMPEPKAFLAAARHEKKVIEGMAHDAEAGHVAQTSQVAAKVTMSKDAKDVALTPDVDASASTPAASRATSELGAEEEHVEDLEAWHGHHHSSVPILRLLMNNATGLLVHVCYMAWISAAFYIAASWLAGDLRAKGVEMFMSQGIIIISLIPNAVGLFVAGALVDRGVPTIYQNAGTVIIGAAMGFGVYMGMYQSLAASWLLPTLMQFVIGVGMGNVALPCTRMYEPLERTTGFSFGYNIGYGIIGGTSPLVITAITTALPSHLKSMAPPLYLLALAVVSLIGCVALRLGAPRLNKPFVGKLA